MSFLRECWWGRKSKVLVNYRYDRALECYMGICIVIPKPSTANENSSLNLHCTDGICESARLYFFTYYRASLKLTKQGSGSL